MRIIVKVGAGLAVMALMAAAGLWLARRPQPADPLPATRNSTAALLDNAIQQGNRLRQDGGLDARREQAHQGLEREYPGLIDRLGLTDREASELFDLLAAQERVRSQTATHEMQHLQRRQEAEQLAVLGTTRHAIFLEYLRIRQSQAPRQ